MQIDCYGFDSTSQWFKRKKFEPHLIKEGDGVLYISFGYSPHGPIHRIDLAASDAITLVFPPAARGIKVHG